MKALTVLIGGWLLACDLGLHAQVTPTPFTSAVYDEARREIVFFGGYVGAARAETWTYQGTRFTQRFPATTPPAQQFHSLAYDSDRREVVLALGNEIATRTWIWDGSNWTSRIPLVSPRMRDRPVIAYDKRHNHTVLFGGIGGAGYLNDTWVWDGTNWQEVNTSNRPQTSADGRRMAFDEARNELVLFGGRFVNETWIWRGTNWEQRVPANSPPARGYHGMSYDPLRRKIVVFGGETTNNVNLGDTWLWDGINWSEVHPSLAPTPRQGPSSAYDPFRQAVLIAGGSNGTNQHDVWFFDGLNWTEFVECVPPASGLISWWPGDGNSSDLANGNVGSLNGDASFAPAMVEQGFRFLGGTGYVSVADSPSLRVQECTLASWVRIDGLTGDYQSILSKGYGANHSFAIFTDNSNRVRMNIFTSSGPINITSGAAPLGAFFHIAGTWDGTTMRLFLNGQQAVFTNGFAGPVPYDSNPVLIGMAHDNRGYVSPLNGIVDEIQILNRAMSGNEIAAIYAASSAGVCKPQCAQGPPGLISWWPGDGDATDPMGGNGGSLQNGVAFVPGKVRQSFSFDPRPSGSSNPVVRVPDVPDLHFGTNELTIEAWIKLPPLASWNANGPTFLGKVQNGGLFPGIVFYISGNGQLGFAVTDLATGADWGTTRQPVFSPGRVDDDQWHHVAGVRVASGYELYVDGNRVATRSEPARDADNTAPLLIGAQLVGSSPGEFRYPFKGQVDELAIYRRALSSDEIASIYAAGGVGKCEIRCLPPPSGLLSWWPADGNANDVKGTNHGSLFGGARFDPGRVGQTFMSDGQTGSYVNVGALNLPATFTVQAWIKLVSFANRPFLLFKGDTHTAGDYYLQVEASGQVVASVRSSAGAYTQYLSSEPVIVTNRWQFLTWRYDGNAASTQKMQFFVDGAQVSSEHISSYNNGGTPLSSDSSTLIGIASPTSQQGFDGAIDELAIWGQLLSATEIASIYAAGNAGMCKPLFAPTDLSGLAVWQDAGTLDMPDGARVSFWPKRGGLAFGASQDTASRQPTLRTNVINGRPVVRFGGDLVDQSLGVLADATNQAKYEDLNIGAAGITYFAVARASQATEGVLFGDDNAIGIFDVSQTNIALGRHTFQGRVNVPGDYSRFTRIAGTFSNMDPLATNETAVYINGVIQGRKGQNNSLAAVIGETLNIGADQDFNASRPHFGGDLAELIVYNRRLNADELQQVDAYLQTKYFQQCISPPSGLVSWWPGDGTAIDLVGTNTATLRNGATASDLGIVGRAFHLQGNAYVNVPASATLDVGAGPGFSVECWFAPSDLVRSPIIEWRPRGTSYGVHLWFSEGGTGTLFANITDTANQWHFVSTASGLVQANRYQHVALTYDKSSGTGVIYLNGSVVGSRTFPPFQPETRGDLLIGSRFDNETTFYRGDIDELSVYNRALSSNEVAAIWYAANAGKCQTNCCPQSDLAIRAFTSPALLPVGSNVTITVTVTNNGPETANGIFVTNTLPLGVTLVSANSTAAACGNNAGIITCALGSLTNNGTVTITIVASLTTVGDMTNAALVVANESDPNSTNNSSSVGLTATYPHQSVLLINVNGGYNIDGANLAQTLMMAGARTRHVNLSGNGEIAALLSSNQFDQIWIFDLSSGVDNYSADWQAIADWYNARTNVAIICDGRIISSYWSGRWQDEGRRLTQNYYENMKPFGGGLMLGTDHNDYHSGINSINTRIGLAPFTGNFNLNSIPVDIGNPLMWFPNSMGNSLSDDSSPGQTPFGLQPNHRILYSVAWHSGNPNTPGISSTISGVVGIHIAITAPANGSQFDEETSISFQAQQIGGSGTVSYTWNSDRDGMMGIGSNLQIANLSTGIHRITLVATNAAGAADAATIQIAVLAVVPTVGIALRPTSDTGQSNTDNITADATPTFDVVVNKSGRIEVDFTGDGITDDILTNAAGGTYQFTSPSLPDGDRLVAARFIPRRGNEVQASLHMILDTRGARVTDMAPNGQVKGRVDYFDVKFDSAVAAFTPAALSFSGPIPVALANITQLASNAWRVNLASPLPAAVYSIVIGPNIFDLAGNLLDQDGDGINGEGLPVLQTFDDKVGFISATLATNCSEPYPNLGCLPGATSASFRSGMVTFAIANPSICLHIGGSPDADWTPLLLGNDIAISGSENLDVTFDGPVFAAGFDFVEPASGEDSTFSVTLKSGPAVVGSFSFNASNDIASFIGVQSAVAFDRMEIRETVGGVENEFFGQFWCGSLPLVAAPEDAFYTTLSVNLPDLVVAHIVVPTNATLRSPLTVTWAVTNIGNDTSTGPWQDTIFLADNPEGTNRKPVRSFTQTSPIRPGSLVSRTETISLPQATFGDHYVIVQIDSGNQIFEGFGETNNLAVSTNEVHISAADLVVESVLVAPSSARFGEDLQVTWVVRNSGDAPAVANWTDNLYLSTNAADRGVPLLFNPPPSHPLSVGAGETYKNQVTVRLPLTTSFNSGTYFINVFADSTDVQLESNENNNIAPSDPVQINVPPLPDLSVHNISSPATALAGQPILISWTITNQGSAVAAGPWIDSVLLSTNATGFNAQPIAFAAYSNALVSHATLVRSESIVVPPTAVGPRFIVIHTDGSNQVFEFTAESNNVAVAAQSLVVQGPDLQPASIAIFPTNPVSGDELTVTWDDRNTGLAAISVAWNDLLVVNNLTTGQALFNTLVPYNFEFEGSLTGGQISQRRATFRLPEGSAGAGVLRFVVTADSGDKVLEYDSSVSAESNNQTTNTFTSSIAPYPDLVVSQINAPTNGLVGQTVQLSWIVSNQGNAPAIGPWTDTISLPSSANDAGAKVEAMVSYSNTLSSGQSMVITGSVVLPPADYNLRYFVVHADATNAVVEGDHETNNVSAAIQPILVTPPDLSVANIQAPNAVYTDSPFEVQWTILNLSPAPAIGSWVDRIYLSRDNRIGDDIPLPEFSFSGTISANQAITRIQPVTVKRSGITNGNYWLVVETDASRVLREGSETNNIAISARPTTVIVEPLPDLAVEFLEDRRTNAFAGTTFTVRWRVRNVGPGSTASAGWYDRVVFANSRGSTEYHVPNASYLSTGEAYENAVDIAIPNTAFGDHTVTVIADAQNQVRDLNRSNNSTNGSFDVIELQFPNLHVEQVQASESGIPGQPIFVSWIVTNLNATVPPGQRIWTDSVWLSTDTRWDSGDRLALNFVHTNGLGSNDFYIVRDQLVTLPLFPCTNWYVIVETDRGDAVEENVFETDIDNRTSSIKPVEVTCIPLSDLIVDSIAAPTNTIGGEPIRISWRVVNQGAAETPTGFWYDSIFLVSDTSEVLLGVIPHYGVLEADSNYVASATLTIPLCLSGSFYVRVVVDGQNHVTEFDPLRIAEGNNSRPAVSQTLIAPAALPDLQLTSIGSPTNGDAGSSIRVSWSVTNAGAILNGNWTDGIFFSRNPSIDSATLLGSFPRQGPLDTGGGYSVEADVTLPGFANGHYFIFVATDSANQAKECAREDNNVRRSTLINIKPIPVAQPPPPPDLQVTAIAIPRDVVAGNTVTISWTATNSGAGGITNRVWRDTVWLSSDSIAGGNDILLGTASRSETLPPGASYVGSLTLAIPIRLVGDFFVVVCADTEGTVGESNNGNNCAPSATRLSISPAILADLTVSDVTVPVNAVGGQSINVAWTVTNGGNGSTDGTAWYDAVFLSRDQILDATDPQIGFAQHIGGLSPQATYNQTASAALPAWLSGAYYIFVCADQRNAVFEAVEDNNSSYTATPLEVQLQPPADLIVASITVPPQGVPGQSGRFLWTIQNSGYNSVTVRWTDSLYLSTDDKWDIEDTLIARVPYTGALPLLAGANVSMLLDATLPGVVPGNYRVIVRTDVLNNVRETNEANNIGISSDLLEMTVTDLELGVPYTNHISLGDEHFYRVTNVPPDEVMSVALTATNDADEVFFNELFTRFGAVPNRGQLDFAYRDPFSPSQRILVPETLAGDYYQLVRGEIVPRPPRPYTIEARLVPFEIEAVSPRRIGNNGQVTLTLQGAKFQPGALVQLVRNQSVLTASNVIVVDSTEAKARFQFKNATRGVYNIHIINPDGSQTNLANAVTIDPATDLRIALGVEGALVLRPQRPFDADGTVVNRGNVDIPYVIVSAEFSRQGALRFYRPGNTLPRPTDLAAIGVTSPDAVCNECTSSSVISFVLRDLSPGEELSFSLRFPGMTAGPFDVRMFAQPMTSARFVDELQNVAEMARRSIIDHPEYSLPSELASRVGSFGAWWEYVAQYYVLLGYLDSVTTPAYRFAAAAEDVCQNCLNDCYQKLTRCVETKTARLLSDLAGIGSQADSEATLVRKAQWSLDLAGCASFDGLCVGVVCDDACVPPVDAPPCSGRWETIDTRPTRVPGSRNGPGSTGSRGVGVRACGVALQARDPNEMIGPTGYGPEAYVSADAALNYRINFENISNATAAATRIVVHARLDPHLEPRSVRLKDIGFGSERITIPPNRSFYQDRVKFGSESNFLYADVRAVIDVANRQVSWTLTAIDPATGEQPNNPAIGLLPPDDDTHRGEGFVTLSVRAKDDQTTGTVVTNSALIFFDTNLPLETNPWQNMLDALPPSSVVKNLPPLVPQAFAVSWDGIDDPGGSGVQSFDLYVSEDNGPPELWLAGTTNTTALFNGTAGHSYGFYSVAQDNTGNIEEASGPDTQTSVSTNEAPILAPLPNQLVEVGQNLVVAMVATDPDGPAALLAFQLDPGAPLGARIDSTSGLFQWQPMLSQAGTSNQITVRVADHGEPSLSTSQSFAVIVRNHSGPAPSDIIVSAGGTGRVPIGMQSGVPLSSVCFTIQFNHHDFGLLAFSLTNLGSSVATASVTRISTNQAQVCLSASAGRSLSITQELAQVAFAIGSNQLSALVPFEVIGASATGTNGAAASAPALSGGRLIVIGKSPLLEIVQPSRPPESSGVTHGLVLYGKVAHRYRIEATSSLSSVQGPSWTTVAEFDMVTATRVLGQLQSGSNFRFYRVLDVTP